MFDPKKFGRFGRKEQVTRNRRKQTEWRTLHGPFFAESTET